MLVAFSRNKKARNIKINEFGTEIVRIFPENATKKRRGRKPFETEILSPK